MQITKVRSWPKAQPWLSTILRFVLAAVWIAAGASKITDLPGSVDAVFAFRILPEEVARFVGAAQPFVEIALGGMLLVGFATRVCALASGVANLLFIAAIISASMRGLRIDCGCFGGGGDLAASQSTTYLLDILRDGGIVVASGILAIWPRTFWSVDALSSGQKT